MNGRTSPRSRTGSHFAGHFAGALPHRHGRFAGNPHQPPSLCRQLRGHQSGMGHQTCRQDSAWRLNDVCCRYQAPGWKQHERPVVASYCSSSQVMRSPFSCGVQSRPSRYVQLNPNHFSTFASSVNRSGFAEGAKARICRCIFGTPFGHVAKPPWQALHGISSWWAKVSLRGSS